MNRRQLVRRILGIGSSIVLMAGVTLGQSTLLRSARTFRLTGSTADATRLLALADVGSLNGPPDGLLDLITAEQNQLATVLFGNGDGTFSGGPNTNLRTIPTALAVDDFDGDGVADLLVGDTSNNVQFFRGFSDGPPFQRSGAPAFAGPNPVAIAVVDFDGNGALDAIVVDEGNQVGGITVLRGNGDGSFVAVGDMIPAGASSTALAVADFNGDGLVDVAVTNGASNDVTILRGDGAGGFTPVQAITVGAEPAAVAAADLNGDTRPDLLVTNRNSDSIAVLDALADGTFDATPRFFPSGSEGSSPTGLALGDLNGDGNIDALTPNNRSSDASVLLGDGRGNFAPPRSFVADQEPLAVATGDVNGDGIPDAITVNRGTQTPNAAVLLSASYCAAGGDAGRACTVDNECPDSRCLVLGAGSLGGVEDVIAEPNPTDVASGDVDNDGLSDLILGHNNGDVVVYRAEPTVGFAPLPNQPLRAAGDVVAVASGDFNADGRLDIVAVNKSTANISMFVGVVAGGFSEARNYPVGADASAATVGDWNSDGRSDVAVTRQVEGSSGAVDILLADPDGSLAAPISFSVGTSPVDIDWGDFNKDGQLDLVVANSASDALSILIGNGDGTFHSATSLPSTGGPRAVAVADFDRDGFDDVAVARSVNSNVTVLYGDGQGGFPVAGQPLGVSGSAAGLAARDLTGDMIPDLLVTDQVSNAVLAFASTGSTRQLRDESVGVSRGPMAIVAADVDGDGRYDGVAANAFVAGSASVLTNIGATPTLRGDANADEVVSSADALAVVRELGDGNGARVEQVQMAGGSYAAAPGVDANGDGFVTRQDALAVAHRLFNL
ncbi:MAG: FG-GAP-like repeat-containing protein [Candidatus Binatia bacterium]